MGPYIWTWLSLICNGMWHNMVTLELYFLIRLLDWNLSCKAVCCVTRTFTRWILKVFTLPHSLQQLLHVFWCSFACKEQRLVFWSWWCIQQKSRWYQTSVKQISSSISSSRTFVVLCKTKRGKNIMSWWTKQEQEHFRLKIMSTPTDSVWRQYSESLCPLVAFVVASSQFWSIFTNNSVTKLVLFPLLVVIKSVIICSVAFTIWQ